MLEQAIARLQKLNQLLLSRGEPRGDGLHASARNLQRGVRRLGALVESSAGFSAGQARALGTVAGYTAGGAQSPVAESRRTIMDA